MIGGPKPNTYKCQQFLHKAFHRIFLKRNFYQTFGALKYLHCKHHLGSQEKSVNDFKSKLNCLYLHGFASGPSSSKAIYFAEKLTEMGINVLIPDLNYPSFENLTLTSQLAVIDQALIQLNKEPLVIFGSSMGGLLAAIKSETAINLRALVLMAPGFGLLKRWPAILSQESIDQWRDKGSVDIFHHGLGRSVPLNYHLIEDAQKYQTENLHVHVPTLVFHGKNDTTVPISESEDFARNNPHSVELHTLDDDHQLIASLPFMWQKIDQFLAPVLIKR
jgi:uncharacterized protein